MTPAPLGLYLIYVSISLTYIYFHPFNREYLHRRIFIGHKAVELMAPFVPLNTVEVVTVKVVAAYQVSCITSLDVAWDPNLYLRKTADICKKNESMIFYLLIEDELIYSLSLLNENI